MPGFEFVYRIPIDVGNVHVCVLRNRISFLSTVSRFSRIHRFYISRTFTPSDPSLLLSSNLRPFSFSAVFGKDSCVSLVINKTQRRSRKYLRREERNRRAKKKNATSKGRFLRSLCFVIYRAGDREATSNRAELLTGISGSILERSVCRGEAC